jgi:hypothetical protein
MLSEIKINETYISKTGTRAKVLFAGSQIVFVLIEDREEVFSIDYFEVDYSEILPEPERWFEITAKRKTFDRPEVYGTLYKSEADFTSSLCRDKSDFEFIKLREVVFEN